MIPELRQTLLAADGLLRRNNPRAARQALESLAASDASTGSSADFQFLLAQACFQSSDPDSARIHAVRALALRPELAEAHHLHGLVMADLELLDDAVRSLERALELRPDDARTCANLGAVYRKLGMPSAAIAMYRRATSINPSHAQAWRGLAETLQADARDAEALIAWKRWSELVPDQAEASAGMGWALARARRWGDAEAELIRAAGFGSAEYNADTLLAFVRRERGDIEGALAAYRRGSERAPAALTPRFGAALALPQIYSGSDDVKEWRARYGRGIAGLSALLPRLLEAPAALWDLDWSNFYLGYQGEDDLALQRQYADLISALALAAAPEWSVPPQAVPRAARRLRVGFASSHFRRCTVGAYFESWLTGLDQQRFAVQAFYFGTEIDTVTQALRAKVDLFVQVQRSARVIAERIRAAKLDVLIYPQLGMDGLDATLAALRLAPVQCVAWGHPVTSGSAAIDYYFSCAEMEPPDAHDHYREKLLLLPGLGTEYVRPSVRRASRAEFGLPDRVPLYVCPQSLFKIHPDNDALFGDVLKLDARGRLIFCAELEQPGTVRFQDRIRRALDAHGIDFTQRVIWQPMRRQDDFRALLSVCDVMLDTRHWSGGNTSLDALAAGLPIVTHPGRFLRGRQSAAMLRELGLSQLVAAEASAVARVAVEVANDAAQIRSQIATESGRIFNRREPLRMLEQHLLRIAGWDG